MPADFDACQAAGGKIRTVSGPNKEHGLMKGEYVHYCRDHEGKSHRGYVKKYKKLLKGKKRYGETK